MKTLGRVLLLVAVLVALYFLTIGSGDLYRVLDFFSNLVQFIAENYMKK